MYKRVQHYFYFNNCQRRDYSKGDLQLLVRLHLEEGRTLKGLAAEYGVSKASISIWVNQFREECQTNEEAKADYDYMKENLQLKKQLAELQKENDFLKKAAAFFAKEID